MLRYAFALALVASLALPGVARAKDAVVVAPFSPSDGGQGGAEYRFIGHALADMLTHRLLASDVAAAFGKGPWEAVLREHDIAPSTTSDVDAARAVARQLGADQFVVGTYRAAWPNIEVVAHRYLTGKESPEATAEVALTLDALVDVEKKLAAALFTGPFAKAASVAPLTKDVLAWRHLTLCREALVVQSLGPRATLWLPSSLAASARMDCEAAVARDKNLVDARAFIALARAAQGELKEATALAKDFLKQRKIVGWPDLIASFLVRLSGDAAGAKKILVDAQKKSPGNLHVRSTLGEMLVYGLALDEAEAQYRALLVDHPRAPWFKAQLGKVLALRGQHDAALAVTEEALAIVPDDPILLLEKASREIDAARFTDAEKTLRTALEKDPRIAAVYLRLGYVYLQTDNRMLAKPILKKALYEADRESERRVKGYAHFDLAKLAAREGDAENAVVELSRAIAAGFRDRARIESDTDLAAVRKSPSYQSVMEALP